MGSDRGGEGPFDWVDYGPPYGDVTGRPEWDEAAERSRVTEPPETPDRYVSLSLADATTVIYDRTSTSAWLQSTATVRPVDAEAAVARESTPAGDNRRK